MTKSLIVGLVTGVILATAVSSFAGYTYFRERGPQYADVVQVKTLREKSRAPREECREVVTRSEPKDQKQVAGTVIGAIAGGVLGHQVGSGKGNTAATVAGAAAGGYAGNRIQNNQQEKHDRTVVRTECRQVAQNRSEVVGYEVTYRLNGDLDRVVMDHKPRGDRILIDNGRVVS